MENLPVIATVISDPSAARNRRKEGQSDFWRRFGVTQSTGSRYENGRSIPAPLRLLLVLFESGIINDEQLTAAGKLTDLRRGRGGVRVTRGRKKSLSGRLCSNGSKPNGV
nr:hypothetical protein [Azonexus fungiphilus]